MKTTQQVARRAVTAALLGLGLSLGAAQASTFVDDRYSAYGERHDLEDPSQPPAVVRMIGSVVLADNLAGTDLPVNPTFYDDRYSAYGERHDLPDLEAASMLAGSEDLSTSMPPTAAGSPDPGFQTLPERAPPDTPINPLY